MTSAAVPVIVVELTVTTPVVSPLMLFRSEAADDAPDIVTASFPNPAIVPAVSAS